MIDKNQDVLGCLYTYQTYHVGESHEDLKTPFFQTSALGADIFQKEHVYCLTSSVSLHNPQVCHILKNFSDVVLNDSFQICVFNLLMIFNFVVFYLEIQYCTIKY